MGDFIVISAIMAALFFAVRSFVKNRKAGRHSCGCNCSECSSSCPMRKIK